MERGASEKRWLNYLKAIYGRDISGVRIGCDGGGSPKSVVEKMSKTVVFSQYSRRIAIVDDDRGSHEIREAKQYIKDRDLGMELIISRHCLEYELLNILHVSAIVKCKYDSKMLKAIFTKVVGGFEKEKLEKFFSKEVLDRERKRNAWLDSQIGLIVGG